MSAEIVNRLSQNQKMAAVLTFLEHYNEHGNEYLERIITGDEDETRVKFVNVSVFVV